MTTTEKTDYQRTLDAEPRLRAVVRVVDALCALARPDDRMCHACIWEQIIKPLVSPLVGWGRGKMPKQATEDQRSEIIGSVIELSDELNSKVKQISWADYRAREDARHIPAVTDIEKWMRTSEAFDAFTDVLLKRLYEADPGNGHGVRGSHESH